MLIIEKSAFKFGQKKGILDLPFARLRLKPTKTKRIDKIYVDRELGSKAITYRLTNGKEDSVHIDAFLDYNKDPDFLRDLVLHQLSIEAVKMLKKSKLSKQTVIRRLSTSPSQLYRLLDPANYHKSIDEMLRLLAVLGYEVELNIKKVA